MRCPKCNSEQTVKSGKVKGKQRHKCNLCGYQFTQEHCRIVDLKVRGLAVTLCAYGMSFRAVGDFLGVSHTSVRNWFRAFSEDAYARPTVTPVLLSPGETWHFFGQKSENAGFEKPFTGFLINLSTGTAAIGAMAHTDSCPLHGKRPG